MILNNMLILLLHCLVLISNLMIIVMLRLVLRAIIDLGFTKFVCTVKMGLGPVFEAMRPRVKEKMKGMVIMGRRGIADALYSIMRLIIVINILKTDDNSLIFTHYSLYSHRLIFSSASI